MKVYVVVRYDEDDAVPMKVFDNKKAADSYVNCFSMNAYLHEMELENTNLHAPQYIVHNIYPCNPDGVRCVKPYAGQDVDFIIENPTLDVCFTDPKWSEPDVGLAVNIVAINKEAGNSFADICNSTLSKAKTMLNTHSHDEIKQFITDTLYPIMEEIRIKP